MCLTQITKSFDVAANLCGTGWHAFRQAQCVDEHLEYRLTLNNDLERLKIKDWNQSRFIKCSNITGVAATSGYYIFPSKEIAQKFRKTASGLLLPVEYRGKMHEGLEGYNLEVIIANEMRLNVTEENIGEVVDFDATPLLRKAETWRDRKPML